MPKRKTPAINNAVARDIFNELSLYGQDKQFLPVQNALFSFMTKPHWNPLNHQLEAPRYPELRQGVFDYWFDRLVEEGYIEIDRVTRAIRCTDLAIIKKEDVSID